jgi:hypothetical protein
MFGRQIFTAIADRLGERPGEICLFLESGCSFQEWCLWESYAACRLSGWRVRPRPSYGEAGLMGSREQADLLVTDPAGDRRAIVELALIHDWSTNRWVAQLDQDTTNLARVATVGVTPLQIVFAASLTSPIEVNRRWKSWLDMTSVWNRPTELDRATALGESGQALLRGWSA